MVSLAVIVLEMLVDHTSQMLFSEKDHSISWRYRSVGSFPLLGAMVALGLVSRVIVTSPVKVLLGCACAPPFIPPLSPKLLSYLVARTQLADLGPKFESRVPLAALCREQSGGGYGLAAVV
jgi:hypothetical protein